MIQPTRKPLLSRQATDLRARIRRTIYKDWFVGKRYIDLLLVRKESPLTFAERLVFSFVMWLQRQQAGESKSYSEMACRLGIGREQVANAAVALRNRGLVVISPGRSNAKLLLPENSNADEYFVRCRNGSLASLRYYLLNSGAMLRSRDVAVLSVLYSVATARGAFLTKNSFSGIAKLSTVSPRQVKRSLVCLQGQELLTFSGDCIALKRPSEIGLQNFVNVGRRINVEGFAPFQCGNANFPSDFFYLINLLLLDYQEQQLEARWSSESAREFWRDLLQSVPCYTDRRERWQALLEGFLLDIYPTIWIVAQEQHRETGVGPNCRPLLKSFATEELQRIAREKGLLE